MDDCDEATPVRCAGPGVCPNKPLPGERLCSHHAADVRRGCTPSQQRLRSLGLPELMENPPLRDGPALLLQVGKAQCKRIKSRMYDHGARLVFEELCQKNDTVALLFKSDEQGLEQLLQRVLADWPLCSALTRAPFVTSRCSFSSGEVLPPELVDAFYTVCSQAAAAGHTVKLSAPTSIRRAMLDAILGRARDEVTHGLAASGERAVFHVASVVRGAAFFYHTVAAPAHPPHGVLHDKAGHWHSAQEFDKEGAAKPSVCRAYFKLAEALYEEPSFAAALADGREMCAVDIGASPGGWTDLLSRNALCRVVAFDSGAIDADVAQRPNVLHVPMLLSSSDGGASVACLVEAMGPTHARLDLVVCDANIPPASAATLIAHLAALGLLEDQCRVILTLKSPLRVRASKADEGRKAQGCEAEDVLGKGFEQVCVRHLLANTQHECTLTATFSAAGRKPRE